MKSGTTTCTYWCVTDYLRPRKTAQQDTKEEHMSKMLIGWTSLIYVLIWSLSGCGVGIEVPGQVTDSSQLGPREGQNLDSETNAIAPTTSITVECYDSCIDCNCLGEVGSDWRFCLQTCHRECRGKTNYSCE
jgi:hypothetical protein